MGRTKGKLDLEKFFVALSDHNRLRLIAGPVSGKEVRTNDHPHE
jgi:hypothetical protein